MFNAILILLQAVPPQTVVDASRTVMDYGVVGAVLVLALFGIVFMYITNNKRESARHEQFRLDMQNVAQGNRSERERWQQVDSQRFQVMQDVSKAHSDAVLKNAEALISLTSLIREKLK